MKKIIIVAALVFGMSFSLFSQVSDLSLQKAIETSLANNYDIIISEKNLEVSQTNNSWANTGIIPTVSFVGSGSQTNSYNDIDDYSTTSINAGIDVNWVLFRGFSAKITKESLEKYENMAEGNLAITVENNIQNIINGYNSVLLNIEQLEISKMNMELSNDRYVTEQQKVDIGTSVTYDLLQAKNSYLSDSATYLQSQSTLANSIRQLNYLMQEPVENTYNFTTAFEALNTSFEYDTLYNKMIENNATLQNQYINLELAKLDIRSAKSAYYPTVTAGVSGGYVNSTTDYSTLNTQDNTVNAYTASANVSVSYEIYSGGTRKRAVEVAEIQEEISDLELKDLQRALENQLLQEFELYELRLNLLDLAKENLEAAELNLELSKMKFDNGSINSFNYRDIQLIYLNTALNYQNAIYNVSESYYSLMRLTGGIVDDLN